MRSIVGCAGQLVRGSPAHSRPGAVPNHQSVAWLRHVAVAVAAQGTTCRPRRCSTARRSSRSSWAARARACNDHAQISGCCDHIQVACAAPGHAIARRPPKARRASRQETVPTRGCCVRPQTKVVLPRLALLAASLSCFAFARRFVADCRAVQSYDR